MIVATKGENYRAVGAAAVWVWCSSKAGGVNSVCGKLSWSDGEFGVSAPRDRPSPSIELGGLSRRSFSLRPVPRVQGVRGGGRA